MVALHWGSVILPPCEKRPPQESRPVAWLLHQPEVDVKHQILSGVEAQQVDDMVQLFPVCNLEDPLSLLLVLFRLAVKGQVEGRRNSLGSRAAKFGFSVMMRTSVALKVLQ